MITQKTKKLIKSPYKYEEYKNSDGSLGLTIKYESSKGYEWNNELYYREKFVDIWNGEYIKKPKFTWLRKVINYFNIKKNETRYFDYKCYGDGGWNMWESDCPEFADFVISNGTLYKRTYIHIKNGEWYVNEDNSTYKFQEYPTSNPASDLAVEYKIWCDNIKY